MDADGAVQMVAIVDPCLKHTVDYPVYKQASELGLLNRNKDNQECGGQCWPGSSAWVDFFNPALHSALCSTRMAEHRENFTSMMEYCATTSKVGLSGWSLWPSSHPRRKGAEW